MLTTGAWARIVGNHDKGCTLAYVDLFAGAGVYGDGAKGTAIQVVERAIQLAPCLRGRFRAILNDAKPEYAECLERAVRTLPGVEQLAGVEVHQRDVEGAHAFFLSKLTRRTPAVMFVDPFGYTGVTLDLFADYFDGGDWGRDAILFFNLARINAALSAGIKEKPMNLLFGTARAAELRKSIEHLDTPARKQRVIDGMADALRSTANCVLPFEFTDRGDQLFFASRNEKGLDVMKKVMAKRSTDAGSTVPSFSFTSGPVQSSLFAIVQDPLADLCDDLLHDFAGLTLTFGQVFHSHHVSQPYVEQNYREAILRLEEQKLVSVTPAKRRMLAGKKTLAENVRITFPGADGVGSGG
jgi:three-Cys-motif partner protein